MEQQPLRRWRALVGVMRVLALGPFLFIIMGMLHIRCSGHPFPSFKGPVAFGSSGHFSLWNWACWISALYGIFTFVVMGMLRFGCSGHLFPSWDFACCVSAIWASFPFMKSGMLRLGNFGHLSFYENGQVAFLLFWLLVNSLKFGVSEFAVLPNPLGFNRRFDPCPMRVHWTLDMSWTCSSFRTCGCCLHCWPTTRVLYDQETQTSQEDNKHKRARTWAS